MQLSALLFEVPVVSFVGTLQHVFWNEENSVSFTASQTRTRQEIWSSTEKFALKWSSKRVQCPVTCTELQQLACYAVIYFNSSVCWCYFVVGVSLYTAAHRLPADTCMFHSTVSSASGQLIKGALAQQR